MPRPKKRVLELPNGNGHANGNGNGSHATNGNHAANGSTETIPGESLGAAAVRQCVDALRFLTEPERKWALEAAGSYPYG